MRYETMELHQKKAFLQRLHRRLNRDLFNGELKRIKITTYVYTHDNCLAFHRKEYCGEPPEIVFNMPEFEKLMRDCATQHEQGFCIVGVLLHEMIHQYCDERGINDRGHNDNFQKAAEEHGLHSEYRDGERVDEWLKGWAWVIPQCRLRIR